ncbi:molecular chaperone Hsp33 [Tamilnaduibacter salinus]|uniref:33 kDa chaperonin n=1 Tax=Tamilnaduibacter salinus TaxID=1484056 RepID=A0A2U1CYR7_9GAMM|nr:Hsp33 family molecular chaperone HslO [Tamilnaduibacter salinus]PVY77636.1 molecular chaperone Hsp33 [Tamilnaduibacter salinus]
MAFDDEFQRFLFEEGDVRGEWVRLSDSYRTMTTQADYPASIRHLLGESLAASVLLSGTLKFDGSLSIQAQGNGPVRALMAECTHQQNLRGLARFDAPGAGADESLDGLLGQGQTVITITPESGQRYQGIVPRERDTLSGCLEDYFERSEQIDTRLFLFADDHQAAGLLIQRLPGSTEVDPDLWDRVTHLAGTIKPEELLTLDSDTLLHRLFHEEALRLYPANPVQFRCSCNRDRTLSALESIGEEECYSILREQGSIDMDCQFCHAQYRFDRSDIDRLFHGQPLH